MWTLFCNVCIDFSNSQIWKEIMLELNGKPSSVTMFVLNWFSLPKPGFLEFISNFRCRNPLKNQYLPHFESKFYQINFIKSCSSRCFQQHQRSFKTFSYDLIWFSMKKSYDIQDFWTASPNVMEPSPCTPPHWKLSKDTKNTIWSIPVWWISYLQNKTKQNKTNQTTFLHT
jgi:hypothetical protein